MARSDQNALLKLIAYFPGSEQHAQLMMVQLIIRLTQFQLNWSFKLELSLAIKIYDLIATYNGQKWPECPFETHCLLSRVGASCTAYDGTTDNKTNSVPVKLKFQAWTELGKNVAILCKSISTIQLKSLQLLTWCNLNPGGCLSW